MDEDEELQITSETLDVNRAMSGNKGILSRLRRALDFGLRVAGRDYVFLCFGESQVRSFISPSRRASRTRNGGRERGCWMISETGTFTVRNILDWMGDLSEERNIAKHAARQGLVSVVHSVLASHNLQPAFLRH